ncbi:hypothetical protein D3C87_1913400 [compost metagenome]
MATARFARSLPPWKIGKVIFGRKLHTRVPLSNRPDSSPEPLPMLPVSEMLGKNAARAAPMLALAASS